MAKMTPRELLERRKAEGKLPPDYDIEAALTSSKARPVYVQVGKPMPPKAPQAPQGTALPRGQKDVVVAHRGKPVDLRVMAARISALAEEGTAEAATAIEAMAVRLESLASRIGEIQAGLTALEAATATAAGRLAAQNEIAPQPDTPPAPAEAAVPDMWAPPEEQEQKQFFPLEVPMRRPNEVA